MRLRLAIIFLLIVLVPLGLLAWLGLRVSRSEQELVKTQFEKLQRERLREVETTMRSTLDDLERRLLKTTALPALDPEALREIARTDSLLRNTFALSADAKLIHPHPNDVLSEGERAFLHRTRAIWERGTLLDQRPGTETATASASHGWLTWYWDEGVHFLFWRRHDGGGVTGGEVERIALVSRLVGKLPSGETERGRIALLDGGGAVIHQWGALTEPAQAAVSHELAAPLDSFRLEYYPAPEDLLAFSGDTARFNVLLGLGAVTLALLAFALYFYREYTRDLREAARRISFVTQVSHELKTPLTNIRLYAELLLDELEGQEGGAEKQLGVIVSESQRLTRLINNILTFSKQRRGTLTLERAPTDVDDVIGSVLGHFTPSLVAKGLVARFQPGAKQPVLADRDALGQIIANLISNVEKYASSGGEVKIESAQNNGKTTVTVTDRGPGIPPEHRARVFEPFYRISDRLSDGVAGTGIGLTIARDLARLHGGDLVLGESEVGASFQLIL